MLSWRVSWSLGTAREHVRVARALATLPAIDEALSRGEVSYCQTRAMTRVATPENERVLLMDAKLTTGAQLERICRKYKQLRRLAGATPADEEINRYVRRRELDNGMVKIEAVLFPEEAAHVWACIDQVTKALSASAEDAGDAISASSAAMAPTSASDVSAETCDRSEATIASDVPAETRDRTEAATTLGVSAETSSVCPDAEPCAGGCTHTTCILRGGSVNWSGIEQRVAGRDADPLPSLLSSSAQYRQAGTSVAAPTPRFNRADGLVALARRYAMGTSSRTPIEIVVTVPATVLQDGVLTDDERIAVLADGTAIEGNTARRLSCDAGIVQLVESANGTPLTVGRRTRSIPASITYDDICHVLYLVDEGTHDDRAGLRHGRARLAERSSG